MITSKLWIQRYAGVFDSMKCICFQLPPWGRNRHIWIFFSQVGGSSSNTLAAHSFSEASVGRGPVNKHSGQAIKVFLFCAHIQVRKDYRCKNLELTVDLVLDLRGLALRCGIHLPQTDASNAEGQATGMSYFFFNRWYLCRYFDSQPFPVWQLNSAQWQELEISNNSATVLWTQEVEQKLGEPTGLPLKRGEGANKPLKYDPGSILVPESYFGLFFKTFRGEVILGSLILHLFFLTQ